ncbi:MAG: sulfite exporter TauE/SafE family protein [Oscillospiraceae bacterium]|nr:sulfite exporter TauE/SafE family protein [Oscillospiraceae bacterium]MBQ4545353.1 sulfite exporter TauE/SafE family protein [Oscillospiraceae bacterium]MBQ6901634.1 sulfite exporter TauE/SafE family protein [Oscillospiraceae bacterium]
MKIREEVKYVVSGSLAGIANGFFGAGGGMFLVPLFCRWVRMEDKRAFATSLAVIMPLSVVSGIVYLIKGEIDFFAAVPYLLGGLIGGIISGCVFKKMSSKLLRRVLALFIIYGGVRALLAI